MRSRLLVPVLVAVVAGGAVVTVLPDAVSAAQTVAFARNAGKVGGIRASRTPTAGRLVALNDDRQLPRSVIPGRVRLETLARGERVRGVVAGVGNVGDPVIVEPVDLPVPASVALDADHVMIDGFDEISQGGCTGTWQDPVSNPGYACVYVAESVGISFGDAKGIPTAEGSRFGFSLEVGGPEGAYKFIKGTWVYTAP